MKLILPSEKYKNSYFDLLDSAKNNNDYSKLGNASLKDNETFDAMIMRLKNRRIGKNIVKRDVPSTIYWIIVDNKVIGITDMRHKLNKDYFERFGHVSYYIKKEERNKKYATKALNLVIKKYIKMCTKKILITCLEENEASKKVILKNGGVFEKTVFDKVVNNNISRYILNITHEDTVIPRTVWLTTNRTCNSKCNWCYASKCRDKVMKYEDLKKYVNELKKININKVILIGGEPTINENIFKIIKYITNKGISVSMASNGRKFSDYEFAKKIVKVGLKICNISIKGSNEFEYMQNTNALGFKEMIEGYHNLKELGINVSTSYVLCDKDYSKFDNFLKMFIENKLDNIVFQLYKPSIDSNDSEYDAPTIKDIVDLIEYAFNKISETKINFSFEMSIPLCCLSKNLLEKMIMKKCITTCCHISKGTGMIFDSDFNILPCNHFANHPLNNEKVKPNDIVKFWNSKKSKQFRKIIKTYPSEICQSCSKWEVCGGGCFLRWFSNDSHKYINNKYCKGGE